MFKYIDISWNGRKQNYKIFESNKSIEVFYWCNYFINATVIQLFRKIPVYGTPNLFTVSTAMIAPNLSQLSSVLPSQPICLRFI